MTKSKTISDATDEDDFCDIVEDIQISLLKSWHLAILVAFICAVFSFKSIIHNNSTNVSISTNKIDRSTIRHIPSNDKQEKFRKIAKYMESSFYHESGTLIINFRFNNYTSSTYNPNISSFLMSGVTFVIPEMNYFQQTSRNGSFDDIRKDALDINPKPSCILKRHGKHTDWSETGVVIYFSFSNLQKYGLWGGNSDSSFNPILSEVKKIARKHSQFYIMYYHPYAWGVNQNPLLIQQIEATRTGYNIHSKVPVGIDFLNERFDGVC